ncbi:class I SAM-dependent methyltransferase [Phormidium tenue FACHB-886]|nr:class I SAM-dependent methyltransferase [Phormidium tenue FACHB-886]
MSETILDQYVTSKPSDQNALDIFKAEWASKLPEKWARLQAGSIDLFEDTRIAWAVQQFGGVQGRRLLELGPLEAGHTYMLERAGAASITAVEANTRAYLKCLIVKEILQLKRSRFLCGDFIEYLRGTSETFDACVASGVLYHMRNPVELLYLLTQSTDRVFIWTHYFDRSLISADPGLIPKFHLDGIPAEHKGFAHTLYRQEYQTALDYMGFCGGSMAYSHWMRRQEILDCLEFFGFGNFQINFEVPNHPNGPSFAFVASRIKP